MTAVETVDHQSKCLEDFHLWIISSQASHDPSSLKGQVKSNTLTCPMECNYALWNVIIAQHYASLVAASTRDGSRHLPDLS